jgi:cytoskeletal protein RodZ
MWKQKFRQLVVDGFERQPQSPLRGVRPRPSRRVEPPAPEAEHPPYNGIGTELRARRESLGRELEDVADVLHIQPRYLEAIEEGRFDALPGSAYAAGFMRAYGQHLGADPKEVVARFRRESTLPHGPTKLVAPDDIAEPRRPRLTVVLLSLLAAAVLYAGRNLLAGGDEATAPAVEPAPERLTALLQDDKAAPPTRPEANSRRLADAAAAVTAPVDGKAEAAPADRAAEGGAATVAAREAQRDANAAAVGAVSASTVASPGTATPRPSASATQDADAAEDTPPDQPTLSTVEVPRSASSIPPLPADSAGDAVKLPPAPPSADGVAYVPQRFGGGPGARVVVKAKVDSWVQIQAGRSEMLLTRILRPGDAYYAPSRSDLMLSTGNAGGLEIFVDGEPLGPLGPLGAVKRNVSLDADKLLAASAARPGQR